jgi:NAD(P)-dependent dehydrogenase (short-subunit alcohol dehydrogenase family)
MSAAAAGAYEEAKARLREEPRTWLVTGVAGFIGSNLVEALLDLDYTTVVHHDGKKVYAIVEEGEKLLPTTVARSRPFGSAPGAAPTRVRSACGSLRADSPPTRCRQLLPSFR